MSPPGEQSPIWGIHQQKPKEQEAWEKAIQGTLASIAEFVPCMPIPQQIAAAKGNVTDVRPRVYDSVCNQWVLMDTGAACTV